MVSAADLAGILGVPVDSLPPSPAPASPVILSPAPEPIQVPEIVAEQLLILAEQNEEAKPKEKRKKKSKTAKK